MTITIMRAKGWNGVLLMQKFEIGTLGTNTMLPMAIVVLRKWLMKMKEEGMQKPKCSERGKTNMRENEETKSNVSMQKKVICKIIY